ncbi:hypothetical protein TVAG_122960 [Trichomonas vaginalis G3]|uniref:Uncharacterized protein n=1 Tax=Trichomonas vaginalis (strain ATCC PRA-98 / G3) TaxID=412133 RepID=A2DN53_TRIV3|nr:hypothetical protein TVAGG3_1011430 [Trichomonas vaginalis G3]EAY18230.1 hypothetical protein TVAG_122960 [Trichomonas vaginalis G3]KAI5491535.1 hypothetical protein TVAGG3_1011430 [Trichomonas vaginalis G3]|eukprot:XP_001579216.1 hypothetical protein [Trichomonas vaginalis G3]
MNKDVQLDYTFLTDEPYTSELYSSLLEPALNQVKESYTMSHKKPITREQIAKIIISSAAQGAAIGFLRASTKVAFGNMTHDYESQEKKGPKDLYFLQYYTNPKKYPSMLRGLKSELKVEISYKTCQKSLNALSKILINPKNLEFHQSLGVSLVRTFTCNLITASTVYPLSLYLYTNHSAEEIMRKTLKHAGPGSLFSSFTSLGLSIVKSLLPSQKDTISVLMDIIS